MEISEVRQNVIWLAVFYYSFDEGIEFSADRIAA